MALLYQSHIDQAHIPSVPYLPTMYADRSSSYSHANRMFLIMLIGCQENSASAYAIRKVEKALRDEEIFRVGIICTAT